MLLLVVAAKVIEYEGPKNGNYSFSLPPVRRSELRGAGGSTGQRSRSYRSSTGTFDRAPGTSRTSLGTR
jgi:hypothetical protein